MCVWRFERYILRYRNFALFLWSSPKKNISPLCIANLPPSPFVCLPLLSVYLPCCARGQVISYWPWNTVHSFKYLSSASLPFLGVLLYLSNFLSFSLYNSNEESMFFYKSQKKISLNFSLNANIMKLQIFHNFKYYLKVIKGHIRSLLFLEINSFVENIITSKLSNRFILKSMLKVSEDNFCV